VKEDFLEVGEKLNRIGIVRVSSDFYLEPKRKGSNFFVKSPATHDKTWSLCLYANSNRFVDYANGRQSGDIIGFLAYVRGINNWESMQTLKDFYGIADSREKDREEVQRKIRLQQERERQIRERKQEFKAALYGEIDRLKSWIEIYATAIEKGLYEPFTDLWTHCLNEKQIAEYHLDILTGNDITYRRLKPYHENLSSDRFQWILDVLDILQEQRTFTATARELEEITAQRNFELTRQPGQERRCGIEW